MPRDGYRTILNDSSSSDGESIEVLWGCDYATRDGRTLLLCPQAIGAALVPAALSLLTVVGNVAVILIVLLVGRNRRRRTSILITNLALADLLVGNQIFAIFSYTLLRH